ncbi:phage holin family protein [Lysinibacillus sp. NPDC094403]|uniref:phage holin family protein n=1 Tax=Lysinibacillus sp. NPDC094403 TaxID=3390581 RepID=UPI003D0563BD
MEQIERLVILWVTSFVTYFLGGWSILLTTLIVFNVLDYATGLIANWRKRSSNKAFRGGIKKGIMWMWVGVSNLIYLILFELGFDAGEVLPNFVTLYFIILELISLEENSKKLGLAMPTPLSFFIEKLKEIFNNKTGGNMK